MTERQDLRPLSTEDLLPDHDRTRADDPDRTDTTDEYRDNDQYQAKDQYATDTDVDRDRTDVTDTTGYHDNDADRSVVSDQYDDVDTENRQPTGTETYDEQPTALDETADDSVVRDETTQDDVVQQKPTDATQEGAAPLFTGEEVDRFRTEWRGLQSDFVDSPRDAVQHADQLVAQVMQSLATTFADHKKSLEGQWSKGEQVETEELRVALRQYRAFFDKLLTV
ncbi:MAG: hypothetical protein ABIQ18_05800 [Umezawaea sp.]